MKRHLMLLLVTALIGPGVGQEDGVCYNHFGYETPCLFGSEGPQIEYVDDGGGSIGTKEIRRSCPERCLCIRNKNELRPNQEYHIVDCSFADPPLTHIPTTIPNSTRYLNMQGNHIGSFHSGDLVGTSYTNDGRPFLVPVQGLEELRLDGNPIRNITVDTLNDEAYFSRLRLVYFPLGIEVLETTSLNVIDRPTPPVSGPLPELGPEPLNA